MKYLPLCLIALSIATTSCGGADSSEGTESHTKNLPDTTILSTAKSDAMRLIEASGSEFATIGILLDIRAKEALLRSHDLAATADLYISHIHEIIDSN